MACSEYCKVAKQRYGACSLCPDRDNSDLDKRFQQFYESGERVEVEYLWGEGENGKGRRKERFYVGKSTGFRPVFIALKLRTSTGGEAIQSGGIARIIPLGKFR